MPVEAEYMGKYIENVEDDAETKEQSMSEIHVGKRYIDI